MNPSAVAPVESIAILVFSVKFVSWAFHCLAIREFAKVGIQTGNHTFVGTIDQLLSPNTTNESF